MFSFIFIHVTLLVLKLDLLHDPTILRVTRVGEFPVNFRVGRSQKHGKSYLRS